MRIAPNELVFVTPKAFQDIYAPHNKTIELWVKTNFNDMGQDLGGIIWEEDPYRHREVAKKLSPALSSRNIRAMEPVVNRYLDFFVSRMREVGGGPEGIELAQWSNWLAMDLAADMSWNERMGQMDKMRNDTNLDVVLSFNFFVTAMQVFRRFGPLIRPFQYFLAPFSKLLMFARLEATQRKELLKRIKLRGNTDHIDFFEYILPAEVPVPTAKKDLNHLSAVAIQMTFAEFGPMSDWFYSTLFFLLEEKECYQILVHEIRAAFKTYDDITSVAAGRLPFLHACLEESLRMFNSNSTGLPRVSPGAMVDGHFVPKGVRFPIFRILRPAHIGIFQIADIFVPYQTHVQTSIFTLARSPQHFFNPHRYQPQRWLPYDHPLYDAAFANDDRKSFHPFSFGPRLCLGRELAWTQGNLFMAKVLWTFDMFKVPGQRVDLEGSLKHYGFLVKPEVKVRFVPVERNEV